MGLVLGNDLERPGNRRQDFGDVIGQAAAHLLGRDLLVELVAPQPRREAGRCCHAEVGGDEKLFQFLQCGIVQPALGEDAGDALAQLA